MKKILVLLSLIVLMHAGYSQSNQMTWNTSDTLNIDVLYPKIGTALADTIINYLLVNVSQGSVQKITGAFINEFGQQYLLDLLTGNFTGKDIDVIKMFSILNCTNFAVKRELVGRLAHQVRSTTSGYTFNGDPNQTMMGFGAGDYKEPLIGVPLIWDATKGIVILQNNAKVGLIVDYYSVLPVQQ